MALKTQNSRFTIKGALFSGTTPTLGPSSDHLDGTWINSNIYPGELFFNHSNQSLWIGYNNLSGVTGVTQFLTNGGGTFMPVTGGTFSGIVSFCNEGFYTSSFSACNASEVFKYNGSDIRIRRGRLGVDVTSTEFTMSDDNSTTSLTNVSEGGTIQFTIYNTGFTDFSDITMLSDRMTLTTVGAFTLNTSSGATSMSNNVTTNSGLLKFKNSLGVDQAAFGSSGATAIIYNTNKQVFRVTTGDSTVANIQIGLGSMSALTSGVLNIKIGNTALSNTTTGQDNFAAGFDVLEANTTGSYNIGIGTNVMRLSTISNHNIGIGNNALRLLTTGSTNIGVGSFALSALTINDNNVALGYRAGARTTGADNTLLGSNAGDTLTSGSGNIIIGSGADVSGATFIDCIVLGQDAVAYSSSQLVIGSSTHPISATTVGPSAGGAGSFSGNVVSNVAYINPVGYMIVNFNGDRVKIPYWNA